MYTCGYLGVSRPAERREEESRGNAGLEVEDLYGPFTTKRDAKDWARRYYRAKS